MPTFDGKVGGLQLLRAGWFGFPYEHFTRENDETNNGAECSNRALIDSSLADLVSKPPAILVRAWVQEMHHFEWWDSD